MFETFSMQSLYVRLISHFHVNYCMNNYCVIEKVDATSHKRGLSRITILFTYTRDLIELICIIFLQIVDK
jgi:hypothetical protein